MYSPDHRHHSPTRDLIIATFTDNLVRRDLLQARIRFRLPHAAWLRSNLLQDGIVSNLYRNALKVSGHDLAVAGWFQPFS